MDLIFNHYSPLELHRPRYHDRDLYGFERAPRKIFSRPNWSTTLDQILRNQPQTEFGNKDEFQENVNLKHFKPEEVSVKIVDNMIVIEGKHEERQDDNREILRHFVRKFTLPKGCDPNEVVSTLSSDGVLTIKAMPSHKEPTDNKRSVQIQQTGPVRESVTNGKAELSHKEPTDNERSVQIQQTGPVRDSESGLEKKMEKACCC